MPPIPRASGRVLPVSPGGEVLLVLDTDPADPSRGEYWTTIGGATDHGESADDTAVREMWEEAGVRIEPTDLVGPVARVQQAYRWNGVEYLGDATYFAAPLARDTEISFENLEPIEKASMIRSGWWTADVLRDENWADPDLPGLLKLAVDAVLEGDQ
ncbi:NUDIX hydrolase [Nocardioides sp. NPDC057772]|uniref:NUDIX hydrolase n=1 Tax=Nocardioides sp. NPDC057772 TaxID=3346245 RepID=UPI00366C8B84